MAKEIELPLRNVHVTEHVPWWPIATGWWLLLAMVIVALLAFRHWRQLQLQRRQRVIRYFVDQVEQGETAAQRVGQISQLLRRAARQHHPTADTLQGQAWLDLLNAGMRGTPFNGDTGTLLLDGGFRPDVSVNDYERLLSVAQERFARWVRQV